MVHIEAIRAEDILEVWLDIREYIERALKYALGEYKVSDVLRKIKAGEIIPLVVYIDNKLTAVLTLELVQMPQKKVMNIMTAGGACMDGWLAEAVEVTDKLAKEFGADTISIHGRRGWLKTLAQYKYKDTYTVLTKEVKL